MNNQIVNTNSDFLFLYEAVKCNPNGDPDMENKPRIDYETKTNLVTDLRLKRYIRDYLKLKGEHIFVDALGNKKVTADKMLKAIISEELQEANSLDKLFTKNNDIENLWNQMTEKLEDGEKKYHTIEQIVKNKKNKNDEKYKTIFANFTEFNNLLLNEIIKNRLIDIRFFGGAFAIEGFTETYTGPIQINWGYSLNPVELIKTNSITTKFSSSDDNEMGSIGKDYRLYYSLLAFHGTINKNAAAKSGLTNEDIRLFREAIVQSIPASPTRSKLGQYPILFLQVEYTENYNGYLRDLRDFIDIELKTDTVRNFQDIQLNLDKLTALIKQNKNIIKNIYLWETPLNELKLLPDGSLEGIAINELNFSVSQ
ncbi:type I-B CRISPR-associated protein Cas7/Csh2 [candidate division KSB1 bacterium]|nr:type I-B CRISPR-associated protein Cas7/Csh2 [candidate division KSB1 bacterium]